MAKQTKHNTKNTVLDLFCGCGGISYGFEMSGCEIIGGIDFNKDATETFKLNFPKANVKCTDISTISNEDIKRDYSGVDIIVGGPPCQGFSRLNYWDKDRDNDPRNQLFLQYLRFVEELQPKAILFENVKNVLLAKDGAVPATITQFLEERGYNVSYAILCASDYGVPQARYRAIFVALKKEYGVFDFSILEKYKQPLVTVADALSDIIAIEDDAKNHEQGTVFTLGEPLGDYQRLMHNGDSTLHNHMIYYPKDNVQKMMEYVPEGGNWRCVPKELFKSDRSNRYTNYLRRLRSDAPSITIDTGHNVYFHPKFNRVPTIRESARLQSFPDAFIFTGKKGQQFRQVGNAVPPLMAKALSCAIQEVLEQKSK